LKSKQFHLKVEISIRVEIPT